MNAIDWLVLIGFLAFVVLYGVWKTRGRKNMEQYLLAGRSTPWYMVCLSVMATQASAITFLSTPGQAYVDGMRFVQFYLGLPIAMVILCQTAVPIYHRLRVFTAYEYLERRFDLKNRLLGCILFLIQRGLAAGLTIFAPSVILSLLLGWNLQLTVLCSGLSVVVYTAFGGSDAVNRTHLLQMAIISFGMISAFVLIVNTLPEGISWIDGTRIAGKLGRMNIITTDFDWHDRYNIWTGLIGGTFLMLSYFGTDQSQVSRYLTGKSVTQSRIGLLANALLKVPMQFAILFLGIMVFVYYQFVLPPVNFNAVEIGRLQTSAQAAAYRQVEAEFARVHADKARLLKEMVEQKFQSRDDDRKLKSYQVREHNLRQQAAALIRNNRSQSDGSDSNYIFLSFVMSTLPAGLIGLVMAAIFSASMSSTAAELNALASTTTMDLYKRMLRPAESEAHYLRVSRLATVFWGLYAIAFAMFAERLGSLIEAVNILGSLFYGTILGLFLIAFYCKSVGGTATFISALCAETLILLCFFFTDIPYLWYNVIACALMVVLAYVLQFFIGRKPSEGSAGTLQGSRME